MTRAETPSRGTERLRQQALIWVAAVRLGLCVLPVPRVRGLVRRAAGRAPEPADPAERSGTPTPGAIGAAVRGATRAVPRATCLTQALAAEGLLARFGWPAEVHLGVAREGEGRLVAHAWVECRGRVVVGDGPRGHVPIGRLDGVPSGTDGAVHPRRARAKERR